MQEIKTFEELGKALNTKVKKNTYNIDWGVEGQKVIYVSLEFDFVIEFHKKEKYGYQEDTLVLKAEHCRGHWTSVYSSTSYQQIYNIIKEMRKG